MMTLHTIGTSVLGDSPPYGEVALTIAFIAFMLVIIEVTIIRRRAALEHNLRIPLDDGHRVDASSPKGGSSHESP